MPPHTCMHHPCVHDGHSATTCCCHTTHHSNVCVETCIHTCLHCHMGCPPLTPPTHADICKHSSSTVSTVRMVTHVSTRVTRAEILFEILTRCIVPTVNKSRCLVRDQNGHFASEYASKSIHLSALSQIRFQSHKQRSSRAPKQRSCRAHKQRSITMMKCRSSESVEEP